MKIHRPRLRKGAKHDYKVENHPIHRYFVPKIQKSENYVLLLSAVADAIKMPPPKSPKQSRRTRNPDGPLEDSLEYTEEAIKFNQDLINQWAVNAVKDNKRLLELKQRIFPNWSPYIADIYNRIQTLPTGMHSNKIGVEHLMLLYPDALMTEDVGQDKSKYLAPGGKAKAVKDVEDWLDKQCSKKDLYEMQRLQQVLIQSKVNDVKDQLRDEFRPEIDRINKELKQLKARYTSQESRLDTNNNTTREIVINSDDCKDWKKLWDDHKRVPDGGHMDELLDTIAIYLQPIVKSEDFSSKSITHVELIPSRDDKLTRFVVRFATVTLQQEILHTINAATNDQVILKFMSEIRPSYSSAERKKRYDKFGPLQASCQYNYLAVTEPTKYTSFSRVEVNGETGLYHCKKYPKSDNRVKKAAEKARLGLITKPKGFKEEEHQVYLNPLLLDQQTS